MIINSLIRLTNIIYISIKYNLTPIFFKKKLLANIISKLSYIFFKNLYFKPKGLRLKLALEELGPIFIKIGQLISIRLDFIPPDITNELKKLQTNTRTVKSLYIKQIIENEFKCNIKNIFKNFNENPIASASVAQIHTGILKTNEKVIIKIIKPCIKFNIKRDINLLKIIAKFMHITMKKTHRLKPIDVIYELQSILQNEINLKQEAANLTKLKYNSINYKYVYTPKVYWNLLKENILVMEFITGTNITNIKKLNKNHINLKILSKQLIDIFYLQAFKYKFFHADLHPGNIIIKTDKNIPKITFIDCGIMSSLTKNDKNYLAENILAFSQRNYKKVAYMHIKTMPYNKSLSELEKDICCICEPILDKPIKDISFDKTVLSLLLLTKKFQMRVQPKLILFQKTLMTIEGLSRQLNPELNLWKITRHSIEKIILTNNLPKSIIKHLIYKSKINKTSSHYTNNIEQTQLKVYKYLFFKKFLNFIIGYICGITVFFIFLKYDLNILNFLL